VGDAIVSGARHASSLALMASEEVNRQILEAMPGGLVHVAADGAILAANGQALRILGIGYDELTRRYTQDFEPATIFEDGSPCTVAEYPVTRALVTGDPQPPMTIGVYQSDGDLSWAIFTAIPLHVHGTREVAGAIVSFVDITPRKRVEAALQRSEELLRSVLESAPDAIVTADANGRVLFSSRSPSGESGVGRFAWSTVVAKDQAIVKAAFEAVMMTGESQRYEVRGISGALWSVHAAPRREGARLAGVTFVASDVSEQRALEAHVAITDRMASIGTLTAGIAHEVNNPLTYVLANVDWVARSTIDPEAKQRLEAALEGLARIRTVVSDLTMFSHVEVDRKKLLDVHVLIDTAIRMAETETRFRARVVKRYGDAPMILAAEGRLGQVFLNLIVNAAQSLREGEAERNAITITTGSDAAGWLVVEVGDTGIGIAPELIERIFEPFVTTKERGVGTGLGLYICRQVVGSLGGKMSVVSTLGTGTTFRVMLPAATESMERAASQAPPRAPAAAGQRLRVLVADDEPDITAVLSEYLLDHDVKVVESGREAIECLAQGDYDIVFCDLIMGDLTGMDVFEYVCANHPGRESRIVFVTGGPFTARAQRFLSTIPNAVIQKPFTSDDILDAIERFRSAEP
jgi:PAS domain S-box-containing protein